MEIVSDSVVDSARVFLRCWATMFSFVSSKVSYFFSVSMNLVIQDYLIALLEVFPFFGFWMHSTKILSSPLFIFISCIAFISLSVISRGSSFSLLSMRLLITDVGKLLEIRPKFFDSFASRHQVLQRRQRRALRRPWSRSDRFQRKARQEIFDHCRWPPLLCAKSLVGSRSLPRVPCPTRLYHSQLDADGNSKWPKFGLTKSAVDFYHSPLLQQNSVARLCKFIKGDTAW